MKTATKSLGLIGLILLVCLLIGGMVIGCTQPEEPTPTPSPTPEPSPTPTPTPTAAPVVIKEWNIPVLTVLSGPIAYAGLPSLWGAQYAVDEINANGGIRGVPVKVTSYDTAFDNAKAVAAMTKAIPGSLLVIGPLDGAGAAAVSQLAIENRIPTITDCSESELRGMFAPYGLSYFQDGQRALAACALRWLELEPYIDKVAVFYMPPQPSSVKSFEAVQAALTQAGFEVIPIEIMPTQMDFGPAVLKAIDAGADGYVVAGIMPTFLGVGKELYNRGVTQGTELLGTFACTGADLFTVGKGFLENSYLQENHNPVYDSPEWHKVMDAYNQEYEGQTPPATIPEFYDAVYAFKYAVEACEVTGDPAKLAEEREAILDYLSSAPEIQGMQFTYHYVDGDKIAPVSLLQIKDNQYTFVEYIMP